MRLLSKAIFFIGAVFVSGCQPESADTKSQPATTEVIRSSPDAMWLADFAAMQRLRELGDGAARDENYVDAAAYYARASEIKDNIPGPTGVVMAFQAAAAYARTGDHDRAVLMLARAADQGLRLPEIIIGAPEFEPLLERDDFKAVLASMSTNVELFRETHRAPEDAKLIFDDVERFWTAYDLADKEDNADRKAAIFRQHYLAPGTDGLIDYHWIKTQSMEKLVKRIEGARGYYDGIRERTLSAAAYEGVIRNGLRKFVALYPDATVPDVTFVIGRLNSGGTAGATGMLIGLDVWSWAEGVPLDGLQPGFQKVVQNLDLDALPSIVVHEHVHALQQYTGEENVLRGALQEGSADFLAGLALPDHEKPHYYQWGLEREEEIWRRFEQEMLGDNYKNWIGNNSTVDDENWYADLGYFIGARISEAYYEKAEDKQEAIKDLLFVNDAAAILEKSGYADRFAG
ncbi:MAG: hypothetical protein DHS20C05_08830 [Hyphococcus sp.]|nr:MAG: hypothetical protein DHS20C05_08830 [Marinicaulis sp.]